MRPEAAPPKEHVAPFFQSHVDCETMCHFKQLRAGISTEAKAGSNDASSR